MPCYDSVRYAHWWTGAHIKGTIVGVGHIRYIKSYLDCYSKVISICFGVAVCVVRVEWAGTSKCSPNFLMFSFFENPWVTRSECDSLIFKAIHGSGLDLSLHLDKEKIYCKWSKRRLSQYLFIACLHAQEDDVSRSAGQTAFQVRWTADLLCLSIKAVEGLYCVFKQAPFNLHTTFRPNNVSFSIFFCVDAFTVILETLGWFPG